MSIELFIYIASIVGNIKAVVILTAVAFSMATVGWGIAAIQDDRRPEYGKELGNTRNKLAIATFITAIVSALLPDERTIYMMVGAHAGVEAIQSETASKIHQIIDKKLDEYMQQMGGDKK